MPDKFLQFFYMLADTFGMKPGFSIFLFAAVLSALAPVTSYSSDAEEPAPLIKVKHDNEAAAPSEGRKPAVVTPVAQIVEVDPATNFELQPAKKTGRLPAQTNNQPTQNAEETLNYQVPKNVPIPAVKPSPNEQAIAAPPSNNHDVVVTASGLNVRDLEGNILCTVPHGEHLNVTGRRIDVESVRVSVDSSACPNVKDGFVAQNYVRPSDSAGKELSVDTDGLSFRNAPSFENSYQCSLPANTKLINVADELITGEDVTWAKVKLSNPVDGCPSEGYVANAYLKSNLSFDDLPSIAAPEEKDCPECDAVKKNNTDTLLGALKDKLGGNEDSPANPFLEEVKKKIKNPKYKPKGIASKRGLIQMPLIGKRGNIGPCGSFHYSPDKPIGSDAYTNPLTACVFTSVLQDWKKNYCPSQDAGCRLSWGDISHKDRVSFNGHKTHTDGYCIDIRPMAKGDFTGAPLTYTSSNYDKAKMRQLVKLLYEKGGSNVYFNDRSLGTKAIKGHHNHIHVCFKDNKATRATCNNLKVDENVCPELQ